jgi:hypothetical protein
MERWYDYFLQSGERCNAFWQKYLTDGHKHVLYIMGLGFDPRTQEGHSIVFNNKSKDKRDTILLRYYKTRAEVQEPVTAKVAQHLEQITSFLSARAFPPPIEKQLILRSGDDKSVASISATFVIESEQLFTDYTDVIIDISAMPRAVFIPLINKSLDIIDHYNDTHQDKKNLHVVVTENAMLDAHIEDLGTEELASYIHGFRIKETAVTKDHKQVWIPILGENQTSQFDKIQLQLDPVEVCPVVPFPSEVLRRGDHLIIEYQQRLVNDNNVELSNIVYADESNPFQVYRLLSKAIERYKRSFDLLSGCKIIVSALSSKLLTVGAFLAVYEKLKEGVNVGIMHVESVDHDFVENYEGVKNEIAKHNKLFEIWLAGDPYFNQPIKNE